MAKGGAPQFGDDNLRALIRHAGFISHDLSLEEAARAFREQKVSYLALMREGAITGICSGHRAALLLGERFGFALNANQPAHLAQVEAPLVFVEDTPLETVFREAMKRHGEVFMEDVAVVDCNFNYLGLIPTEVLAHAQTRLMERQVNSMRRHTEEMQRSSEQLGQARALWQALFGGSLLGVALCDVAGRLVTMNKGASQLLNIPGLWMGVRRLGDFLSGSERNGIDDILPDPVPGATRRTEASLRIPGKGDRTFRLVVSWIDETRQYCLCMDDITEQRALEQRMKQNEKQQLFDTLVAGIAHELNNKMTPAIGFSDLLADMVTSADGRMYLDCIRSSVAESATIVRQLLQLSRPDRTSFQKIDLCGIARDSLLMLQFELREKAVKVTINAPRAPVWVMADGGMLKQVVMNLVINAIHATEKREDPFITVEISEGRGGPILMVTDNGCGIPMELLGRVFDPFFTTKAPDKGTGLGLSVCLSIMKQHQGGISVRSDAGKGTTFTLMLPQPPEDMSVSTVPSHETRAPEPKVVQQAGRQRARVRILAVDDEANVRKLLQALLARCFDCNIDMAQNGEHALRLALAADYDIIISDIRMPEMDGPTFYRRLREARPELAGQFILCSGNAGDLALEEDVRRLGIPLLRKPFTARQLVEICGGRQQGGQ